MTSSIDKLYDIIQGEIADKYGQPICGENGCDKFASMKYSSYGKRSEDWGTTNSSKNKFHWNLCEDCYENENDTDEDKYCDGGCGTTDIWERSEINMCKICETKKIDKEYEEECAEMRSKGYERDEYGEWEYIGDCGDEADCAKCEEKFVKYCDEWGASNMIGKKGEIHPLEFCYDCWEDEVENSVWNDELEIMVWNKDKYLEELMNEEKPISKLLGLE